MAEEGQAVKEESEGDCSCAYRKMAIEDYYEGANIRRRKFVLRLDMSWQVITSVAKKKHCSTAEETSPVI